MPVPCCAAAGAGLACAHGLGYLCATCQTYQILEACCLSGEDDLDRLEYEVAKKKHQLIQNDENKLKDEREKKKHAEDEVGGDAFETSLGEGDVVLLNASPASNILSHSSDLTHYKNGAGAGRARRSFRASIHAATAFRGYKQYWDGQIVKVKSSESANHPARRSRRVWQSTTAGAAVIQGVEVGINDTTGLSTQPSFIGSSRQKTGFVDGIFASGKIQDIATPTGCFIIKYNLDASVLAVGLTRGNGVALYETETYSIVHVIEREDTVSALDWILIRQTSANNNSKKRGRFGGIDCLKKNESADDNMHASSTSLLAVGGFDGVVSVYAITTELLEVEGATILYEVRVGSEVRSMIFVNNALLERTNTICIAIGEKNGNVSFFSVQDNYKSIFNGKFPSKNSISQMDSLRKVDCHDSSVFAIAFNPEGTLMATGSKEGFVRISRIEGSKSGQLTLGHRVSEIQRSGAVRCLTFSHDGSRLVVGGYDKTIAFLDTTIWGVVRELKIEGTINTVTFDPLNRYLAVGSRDQSFNIYDTSTFHPIKRVHTPGWVSSITWGMSNRDEDIVAIRGANKLISILDLTPIQKADTRLKTGRGMESSLSWSYDGRFLARAVGKEVLVADSTYEFRDVASLTCDDTVRCVRFCMAEGKRDLLAVVGHDGYLSVHQLRCLEGKYFFEKVNSIFLEKFLWVVAWSIDGTFLATGGKGKRLYILSASDFSEKRRPIRLGGRVWAIDFMPEATMRSLAKRAVPLAMAVGTGDYIATIYDTEKFEPTLQIIRLRTVRCLSYHPSLPVLAVGDGRNFVAVVDLINENIIEEFDVGGRVHSVCFSHCGEFLAVASDDCKVTIHDTESFRVLQEIKTSGFALAVSFSGKDGKHIALDCAYDDAVVVRLGPFLGIEFVPLSSLEELPEWATPEAIYRSGRGPSLVQRFMHDGGQDSLKQAAAILRKHPDSIYTFDRSTGEGCFDTALTLRKPNLLKLVMTTLVDGTLEDANDGKRSVLTTTIPEKGMATLNEMVLNYPSEFVVEILQEMAFIRVPFTEPHIRSTGEKKECASSSFADPWGTFRNPRRDLRRTDVANRSLFDAVDKSEVLLTPAVLPLPGLGSYNFLSALTREMPPNVFNNDAMALVLRVMWHGYIRKYFLIDFAMYITFFILWMFYVDMTSTSTSSPHDDRVVVVYVFAVISFMLNTAFTIKELFQADFGRRREHFQSWWNLVDVVASVLVYAYIISTSSRGGAGMGSGSVPLAAVTTLILTLKLLAYLRGFSSTGWLVSVLTQNFLDVRGFVIVLVAILVGFTAAFRVLFGDVGGSCSLVLDENNQLDEDCEKDPYGNLSSSLLSTFELTILGVYDQAIFSASQHTALAILTFVLAITVVLVVALNALIAILSDSYSRVQENAIANRRKERAGLLVEYLSLMPFGKRKKYEEQTKYFHALLEADADGDLLINKEDWKGGLNALKRDLMEMNEENSVATRNTVMQMKKDIDSDIARLRSDVVTLLNEISLEVKSLKKLQNEGGLTIKGKNVAMAVKAVRSIGMRNNFWHRAEFGPLSHLRVEATEDDKEDGIR